MYIPERLFLKTPLRESSFLHCDFLEILGVLFTFQQNLDIPLLFIEAEKGNF